MSVNPLVELTMSGQSICYDGIQRGLITSGELTRLIDEYEIRGITTNPTIFEKAIDSSDDYSDQLREQAERQKERKRDIRSACRARYSNGGGPARASV